MAQEDTKIYKKIKASFWAVVLVIIAVIILWGSVFLAKTVPKIGTTFTSTQLPSGLSSVAQIILGMPLDATTLESLILFLAIFVILWVAISDILSTFSTFKATISWIIGFALAVVAGMTHTIAGIAQIMGLTAGIGAIGTALIVLGTFISAVTLNLGIGSYVRRWRMERQAEIEAFKTETGTAKVSEAIKGLKKVQQSFAKDEVQ